ncbi:MAG: hypothetical protein HY698_13090 [Deltaproteobacteria bacterium]|nr:hypothetical protein [Deltaproteobacteria bacterium]
MNLRACLLGAVAACTPGPGSSPSIHGGKQALDSGPPDTDAGGSLGCDYKFGKTFIVSSMGWLESSEGFDLDDDGEVDNNLGRLSGLINPLYESTVKDGVRLEIFELTPWPESIGEEPIATGAAFFWAIDADEPPDPSNNFYGEGQFKIVNEQFDVNCSPMSRLDWTSVHGRRLQGKADRFPFVVTWRGTADYRKVVFDGEFDNDFKHLRGRVGAAWTSCSLSVLPWPLDLGSSLLDAFVGIFDIRPDIDLDGDGLEELITENQRIVACIDGDGKTRIEGKYCACDPRIADGYSVAYFMEMVPAQVVGVSDWREADTRP